jgi:hypothetical protein
MKTIFISLIGASIFATANAAQVGSFFLGGFEIGSDKYGAYRTLLAAVDLPKGIPANEFEVELRSANRVIVTWYPVKGQECVHLKFTISK